MLIANRGGGLKSRAFTLIELLAVIIIIGMIALITTPVIIGVIGKTERGAFERSIDGLLETVRLDYSTDSFVSPREYYYEGKDLILLTVAEETRDESIGMKGKIEGKGFIYIDEEGIIHIENICSKKYCANGEENNIEITENESGIIPEVGKNDPIIRLIGEKTIYVNLNETYEEQGVVAKTKSGKVLEYTSEITVNGAVITNIDTSVENTYVITYKTSNEGKEVSVTRNVVVLDMKPMITMIPEETTKYVSEQEVLVTVSAVRPNTLTSFIVEIKKDGEVISPEIIEETKITKTILLNETGIYEVKVTVTDNNNHTSIMTRNYKIDSEAPEITFPGDITLKANDVSGFDWKEDETLSVTDNIEVTSLEASSNLISVVGEYEITYTAKDEAGNKTTKTRKIIVTPADGPFLESYSVGSNGNWIKPTKVTITAEIRGETDDELTSFTYQVDDGEEVNVPITNNKSMLTEVPLDTTGKHTITIKAVGKYRNEKSKTIGEFWIDNEEPTLTITTSSYRGQYGTNKELSTFYQATFGGMDGQVVCKNGTTPIDNVNKITQAGEYSISCKAIGNNEKSSSEKTIAMTITPKEFAEVMTGSEIATNDPDNNKRYVGANPNNYVWFNGEKWRIIGLFNGRTKIIRAESIGNMAWDKNASNGGHGDWGQNNWVEATLNAYLNGEYLDSIDFTSQNYIDELYSWNLGESSSSKVNRETMYEKERGTEVITNYPKSWQGAIGLMYPSDYGYATSGGEICGTTNLYNWNEENARIECIEKNWLFVNGNLQWTMTSSLAATNKVFFIHNTGNIDDYGVVGVNYLAVSTLAVKPTLYLKNTVKVMGGTGTSDDPYVLGYGLYNDECTKVERTVMGKQVTSCMLENDPDHNLRYVGSNPNNYVKFNNELWRIIGVFDGYTKIVRNQAYGSQMKWSEVWVNEWSQSPVQTLLNATYFPTIEKTSYDYVANNYKWSIGGVDAQNLTTRSQVYLGERGNIVTHGNPTWNGAVGLIHLSDYYYSTSSNNSICDNIDWSKWLQSDRYATCGKNSWILEFLQWTMTTAYNEFVYGLVGGQSDPVATHNLYRIVPALYLNTNVKIKSGSGTAQDPYLLGT